MNVNDKIHGFAVTRTAPAPCSGSELIEMRHEKTGAQLVWLKNDGENKLFSIAFRTPPSDDTGIFHILEHSVLGGSEKYPVKEPFLDMPFSAKLTLPAMSTLYFTYRKLK